MNNITLHSVSATKNNLNKKFANSLLKVMNDEILTSSEEELISKKLSELNLVQIDTEYPIKFTKFD